MTAPCELELIAKFKERLADLDISHIEDKEMFYLQFLRARDHNLNKAEEMIRKHLDWRKKNEIDNILEWKPPSVLTSEYPYEICGFDLEGNPVVVAPVGLWDVRKICESGMKSDYVRYVDQMVSYILKAMSQSSKVNGRTITKFILLIVPDGFSAFRQITSAQAVDAVLESVRRFEANYPETLKAAFIIDSPKIFHAIFSVIKPLLNSRTLGKVTLACSAKEWKSALLQLVSEDQLPIRLGGSRHSKIPLLNGGRRSPNDIEHSDLAVEANGFVALTVAPGRNISVEYEVENSSTEFSYAFKTEKCDIGFTILFEGSEVVIPYSRLNSHQDVQCGVFHCQKPGKYLMVFDNRFSRFRSKIVRYRVNLSTIEVAAQGQILNPYEEQEVEEPLEQLGLHTTRMETMSL